MHGYKMRTKLNMLCPPAMTPRDAVMHSGVFLRQKHMKQYFETRHGARIQRGGRSTGVPTCTRVKATSEILCTYTWMMEKHGMLPIWLEYPLSFLKTQFSQKLNLEE